MKIPRATALLGLCVFVIGCSGDTWNGDDDTTASDDDTTTGDDDVTADDDTDADDDTAGGDGPYEVIVDSPLTVGGTPLALTRLDVAAGSDGRVYFTGYDGWGNVSVCSFDGTYEGLIEQQDRSLDLQCESIATDAVWFIPRLALDPDNQAAVVWDRTNYMETWGRYLGEQQALFVADTTSVNHPDVAYFDGAFTAVSQWFQAIGRLTFTGLPTAETPVADWDAGPGGSELKGPSIAAGGDEGGERLAWVAYHGTTIYGKTAIPGQLQPTDFELTGSTVFHDGQDRTGYPGWSHVAVDREQGIHVAWNIWIDDGSVSGQHRGLDYRHVTHPDLQVVTSLFVDIPLGDTTLFTPAIATNESLDVAVAFASGLGTDDAVYLLLRDAGAPDFTGAPTALESGRDGGAYNPAATGFGHTFWVLYNSQDGDQIHAVRLCRGD